ncbi:hypothetical protein Lalb_Chr21g0314511 [Lupinus albus]|uniref:Uncharacterized protein n=1 Tax=Lupinus albus TaxID=3870 RepID=A0A6A4N7F3_LUPAL|nr:hypothetical protein Lalb_Chr21g0314511 [Lupinus albus]
MVWLCKSDYTNTATGPHVPVGVSYVKLNKWHESDAEFVRSKDDRQKCLRSYKKTLKCFERVMEKVTSKSHDGRKNSSSRRKCSVLRKMKEITCSPLIKVFYRFLSCVFVLDVVE